MALHDLIPRALLGAALACLASHAFAERADRDKPINFSADDGTAMNYQTRSGALKGNVVITQGTITIHADRIDLKQNPDNSLSATAYGNPVTFREKKEGSDEYYEGVAQRIVYDGSKQLIELFDRALLKQGIDEIRSNYISYNNGSGVFHAEGRPDEPGANGPGARVRGIFQPRGDLAPAPGKAAPDAKGAPAKSAPAPAAKGEAKSPPLTLKPESSPPAEGGSAK